MPSATPVINAISSPNILWEGRWSPLKSQPDTADSTGRSTPWGASFLLFRTSAPRVVLNTGEGSKEYTVHSPRWGTYDAPCTIYWRAGNGPVQKRTVTGAEEVVLFDRGGEGEDAAEQTFEVVFGEMGGHISLISLLIPETHTLLPVFPTDSSTAALRLLFIGASQTTGFVPPIDLFPPPLPWGAYSGWPLTFLRQLRDEGHNVRGKVVARPGIRMVEGPGETEGEMRWGMDRRFWDGWEVEGKGLQGGFVQGEEGADVVFISIGSNDQATGISLSQYLATLRQFMEDLVRKLDPAPKHVVFVAPFGFHSRSRTSPTGWVREGAFEPQTGEMLSALSKRWGEEGRGSKLWFVSTEGWVDGTRCPDMLHPDEEGYRIIVKRLREWCEGHLGEIFGGS